MSIPGEFEKLPRAPIELAPGTLLPCPVRPTAFPPAGFDVVGALLGASRIGAAGRAGVGGSGGSGYAAAAARDGPGDGGSGIPATGIADATVADGGIPRPPRPRVCGGAWIGALGAGERAGPRVRESNPADEAMRASSGRAAAGSATVSVSGATVTMRLLNARNKEVSGFDDSSSRVSASRTSRSTIR